MSKEKVLVVDDAPDITNMLQFYFNSQGYDTSAVANGNDALAHVHRTLPNLILLDINLPDMDGYDVCVNLRHNMRTSHIPVIFLTERGERSSKMRGLELGVDDYITKPFDIEELHLRVVNALQRAARESLTNPVTGLPGSRLIEEQMKKLLHEQHWSLASFSVNNFGAFNEVYGFVAGDDALKFVGQMLNEVVNQHGNINDFIGHVGGADFLLITTPDKVQAIGEQAVLRFEQDTMPLYSYQDRKAGYMTYIDPSGKQRQAPLMNMSVGAISDCNGPFTDIRELSEIANEARQRARQVAGNAFYIERC